MLEQLVVGMPCVVLGFNLFYNVNIIFFSGISPVRRGSNRKTSFTAHVLVEGSVIIECICLALYSLSYQNNVYKRMVLSAQGNPNNIPIYSNDDSIGGFYSLFKWIEHKSDVITKLLHDTTVNDVANDDENTSEKNLYIDIKILPISGGGGLYHTITAVPVCLTLSWIWRLVASLTAYDYSVKPDDDLLDFNSMGDSRSETSSPSVTPVKRRSSLGINSSQNSRDGSGSSNSNNSPTSIKVLLGSLGACEALVSSFRCCGTGSVHLTCSMLSATAFLAAGNKRNQRIFVQHNGCKVMVQVLHYLWTEYKSERNNILATSGMNEDHTITNILADVENLFEVLIR